MSLDGGRLYSGSKGNAPVAGMYPYTGTAYTLEQLDNGSVITFDNANPVTVEIPSGLSPGFNCMIVQLGAGQVSVVAGSGVSLHNRQSFSKLAGQYAIGSLVCFASGSFVLGGDLAA